MAPASGDEVVGVATVDSAFHTPHSALESAALKRSTDGYGREIFIEKDGMNGKPDIWYYFDSKGRKRRKVRKGHGVFIETLE